MIAMTSDNRALLAGGQVLTLSEATGPVEEPPVEEPPPSGGSNPMPETNLAGWWDVGNLTPGSMGTLTDKSTAGRNAAATSAKVLPRQAGMLAGLYYEANASNYTVRHPVIGDYSVAANNISVGTGGALTVFVVWSRPNQRQPNLGAFSTADVAIITIGGVAVLSMTAVGDGTDTLKLFPVGTPVTGGILTLRHTHSARLVFSGSTVDVWLDGAKVITGATNQITLGVTANIAFLTNAHMIFHEAAAWNVALAAGKLTELTAYAARWPLGPRGAANGLWFGQSNADLFGQTSADRTLNKAIAYWTGAISANLLTDDHIAGGDVTFSGRGLYNTGGGWFLNSSTGSANVNAWPLGADGNNYMAAIDSLTPDQKANTWYAAVFWSESDSGFLTYADKATYILAWKRVMQLVRTRMGRTAAQLPFYFINALPFTTTVTGRQTHREAMADLVAETALNAHFMLGLTDDANGHGNDPTYDVATGVEGSASGIGDDTHRDSTAMHMFARRMAYSLSRGVIAARAASGAQDAITAIDASVPTTGGPRIASATYEGTTHAATGSVLVTVVHDGGTDLATPLRAAIGAGWELMDGVSSTVSGTPGAPGTMIMATACARVSTTQLRVTLASLPTYPTQARLYYDYGSGLDANKFAKIGRGNAVVDNFGALTLAAGWRIGIDQTAASQPNNPLHATTYGIALT